MQSPTIPNRIQLQLLREARAIVKHEFGEILSLASYDVFDKLYAFAIRSEDEDLFKLFCQIRESGNVEIELSHEKGAAIPVRRFVNASAVTPS